MGEEIRENEAFSDKMTDRADRVSEHREKPRKSVKRERKRNNVKPFLAGVGTTIVVFAIVLLVKEAVWLPGGTDTPTSLQTSTKIRLIEGLIDDVYVGDKDEEALAEEMYRPLILWPLPSRVPWKP